MILIQETMCVGILHPLWILHQTYPDLKQEHFLFHQEHQLFQRKEELLGWKTRNMS